MQIKRLRPIVIVTLLFLVFTCVVTVSATIAAYTETYILSTQGSWIHDAGGGIKLLCTPIQGEGNEQKIAVGWGTATPSDSPAEVVIPGTISHDETNYTVKAIARGGFRYCDFTSIALPDGVDEIQPEAFFCCQELTSFQIPYGVKKIAPSTFMDCRKLRKVSYTDYDEENEEYVESRENKQITIIGDHAFTSCVSLAAFDCPKSIEEIGNSAFQNTPIRSFFFPTSNKNITVGTYAFADCKSLAVCYFETSVKSIGDYCFANDTMLTIYYTGDSVPAFDNGSTIPQAWRKFDEATNQRDDEHLENHYVPVVPNTGIMKFDQGIGYTIQTGKIYMDGTSLADNKRIVLDNDASTPYASIFYFDPSAAESAGIFESGTLSIPDEVPGEGVGTVKIKTIAPNAFNACEELKGVIFNPSLVQICHQAFYACTNIGQGSSDSDNPLDFSAAINLKEISYDVFQEENATATPKNTSLKKICLPNYLLYIGARAFYNFTKVKSLTFDACVPGQSASLYAIGRTAFGNLGADDPGKISLELPASLNDVKANNAQLFGRNKGFGIDENAFKGAKGLKEVTMEWTDNPDLAAFKADGSLNSNDNRTSFGPSVFDGCTSLARFTANKRLYRIGGSCFVRCSGLKEVFLSTYGSKDVAATKNPWGDAKETSIFGSKDNWVQFTDTVIYVDDARAPGNNGNAQSTNWNSENATFPNDYATNTYPLSRPTIPTYFNVDWHNNDVKYLNLAFTGEGDKVLDTFVSNKPLVAIVKNANNNYVTTRCYVTADQTTVDLTQFGEYSTKLEEIGMGTFGKTNTGNKPGMEFVLPSTKLVKIGERAFYRQTPGDGVTKISYSGHSAGDTNTAWIPSTVKTIERLAFYNSRFNTVKLPYKLEFLGNTVFSSYPNRIKINNKDVETSSNAIISAVEFDGTSSKFETVNNGVYTKDANKPTLIYEAANQAGTFKIASGTVAVGVRALADTNFEKIVLPDSLTTVYGGSFMANVALEEVEVPTGSQLKYIATTPSPGDEDDYWEGTDPFDIVDSTTGTANAGFIWSSTFGAFARCRNLTTFDFTKLTNLKKIGYGAFQNCDKLNNMIGGQTYSYYSWDSSTNTKTLIKSLSTGILDLSGATGLESIGRYAFGENPLIQIAHLPRSDKLYLSKDNDSPGSRDNVGRMSIFASCGKSPLGGGGVAMLMGEAASVCSLSANTRDKNRYPDNYANGQTPYYRFDDSSEIIDGTTRYWTTKGLNPREFLIFTSEANARSYCTHIGI